MSEEMTPGRIAAEAHDRSLFGDETPVPWDKPGSPAVVAWEAGAQAVIGSAMAAVTALADEWDKLAASADPSDLAEMIRGGTYLSCAGELRDAIGQPS